MINLKEINLKPCDKCITDTGDVIQYIGKSCNQALYFFELENYNGTLPLIITTSENGSFLLDVSDFGTCIEKVSKKVWINLYENTSYSDKVYGFIYYSKESAVESAGESTLATVETYIFE